MSEKVCPHNLVDGNGWCGECGGYVVPLVLVESVYGRWYSNKFIQNKQKEIDRLKKQLERAENVLRQIPGKGTAVAAEYFKDKENEL